MFDFMDFDMSTENVSMPSDPYIPEATDCMRCGVCLSQCPTYQLTQDEQESPRSRIRTISKIVVEQQKVTDEAIEHLQNCVQCRACEAICPSQMAYGELFDKAQDILQQELVKSAYSKIAFKLIENKTSFNALLPFVKAYKVTGLQALFRGLRLVNLVSLERADKYTQSPVLSSLKQLYSVQNSIGRVALFSGCISDRFDRETLTSAIRVLNSIGYDVFIPKQQNCCGAIHYHNGEQAKAKELMLNNVAVFNALNIEAIIYCATGCGSQLSEYQQILDDEEIKIEDSFKAELVEISNFVEQHWPDSLALVSSNKHVLVHEPCSQRNVLKNQQAVYQLLHKIPELVVSELADNKLCCGAGGTYMLSHPDNADALRDMKWQHIEQTEADYLVTSNIGCAMHIATGAKGKKPIEIIHPITLLAKQFPKE